MAIELETERLIMKQMCEADAPGMFELNSDKEVIWYTGDKSYYIEQTKQFIKNYDQYTKHKMGRLNTFLKSTGEYIGWCRLKYLAGSNKVDLGYRLHKRYWGKGYATEASIESLNYGFKTLHLDEIIATAMKPNVVSINVMKKLGMSYSHDETCGGNPGVVYKITKEEWK